MTKFLFLIPLLFSTITYSQDKYFDSILSLRENHMSTTLDTNSGVLNTEDLTHLYGLFYFPISTEFKVEAQWVKDKGRRFKMPTSTDRTPVYKRHGYIFFKIKDSKYSLTVYRNMELKKMKKYKNYYFIPFRDETSGINSYGGGRYLDISLYGKKKFIMIDFNLAYNPYCAYSHRYSCPIPPEENTIKVEINAGEKTPSYK